MMCHYTEPMQMKVLYSTELFYWNNLGVNVEKKLLLHQQLY